MSLRYWWTGVHLFISLSLSLSLSRSLSSIHTNTRSHALFFPFILVPVFMSFSANHCPRESSSSQLTIANNTRNSHKYTHVYCRSLMHAQIHSCTKTYLHACYRIPGETHSPQRRPGFCIGLPGSPSRFLWLKGQTNRLSLIGEPAWLSETPQMPLNCKSVIICWRLSVQIAPWADLVHRSCAINGQAKTQLRPRTS